MVFLHLDQSELLLFTGRVSLYIIPAQRTEVLDSCHLHQSFKRGKLFRYSSPAILAQEFAGDVALVVGMEG